MQAPEGKYSKYGREHWPKPASQKKRNLFVGILASIPTSLAPAVTAMDMQPQISTVMRRLLVPATPTVTSRRVHVTVGLVLVSGPAVPSRPTELTLMLMDAVFARRCWRRLRRARGLARVVRLGS